MALFNRDYDLPADELPSWVQETRLTTSLLIIGTTALIYDTILTMDNEIRYFWNGRFSFMKLVFFLNRYIGIIGAILLLTGMIYNEPLILCTSLTIHGYGASSESYIASGSSSLWIPQISGCITIFSADYVLTIRVLALFHNERKLSIVLYTILFLEVIEGCVLTVVITRLQAPGIVRVSPHLSSCEYNGNLPLSLTITVWIVFVAYGGLLLCLALFKGREFWKLNGYVGSRLVIVLIRDQALYYFLAILSSTMVFLSARFDTSSNMLLSDIFSVLGDSTFFCILGSRMFFNLKEAAEHGVNVGTNWTSYSHSTIVFNEPASSHPSTGSNESWVGSVGSGSGEEEGVAAA